MKLYMKPGACSLASHIALIETGADFDIEQVDTDAGRTASGADFAEINPNGYVPALRLDDGQVLTEGAAVLQYIADQAPDAQLAPKPGTLARTRVQQYLNFISSELHKAFGPLFAATPPQGDAREAVAANIGARLDYLEKTLSDGRPYLVGDAFSVADAYAFVVAGWAVPTGVGLDRWPHVQSFVERIRARSSVQQALQAEEALK